MAFLRTSVHHLLFIAMALLPFQPLALIAKTKNINSQEALLAHIMKHMQGPSAYALGKGAMGKVSAFDAKDRIIGIIEHKELQIDALAKKFDKTETTFGSVALSQSLQPVADIALIQQRQAWAKAILDDPQLYADIRRLLKRVKKSEHAVLAYWDATQRENGTKLFARAESFYYAWMQIIFGQKINDNKWALEAAMIQKMLGIAWDLVYYLGGQKLFWDSVEHQFSGHKKWSPWESVVSGVKAPISFINPFWRSDLSKKLKEGIYDDNRCAACGHCDRVSASEMFFGASTFQDKMYYAMRGITSISQIDFGKLGKAAYWVDDQVSGVMHKVGQVGQRVNDTLVPNSVKNGAQRVKDYTPHFIKAIPSTVKENFISGHLESDGIWKTETSAKDPDEIKDWGPWIANRTWGFSIALGMTVFQGRYFWNTLQSTYHSTKNTFRTMKELHIHTIHLARVITTIKDIARQLEKHPVLSTSGIVTNVNKVIANASPELQQLFELLENDTFSVAKDNVKSQLFSRGNVFLVHRLMTKVHAEIVPLLHGVGELDALYAMVTHMKESTTTKMPFSFVEFVTNPSATITIKEGWLPLVRNAVPNTISFGGETANKIIITGPNGGGKSVFLKLLGLIVVMAQSWGIVPAEQVQMTLFNGLRSCIHPEESLEHELSTFMAEKMRVDTIKDFIFTHHRNPQFKAMVLLDEPFRGTVDAESADRMYDLGKEIANLPQVIALIATHVEKPVRLEKDTGLFANYHVRIKELENGTFQREYKLEPGILEWWFTDGQKRSRFIDFVTMEKHKEELAKLIAIKQAQANA